MIGEGAGSVKDTLVDEGVEAGDLVLGELVRRTFANIKKVSVLAPPNGLPGPKIKLPIPPVVVPGKGVVQADTFVEKTFPQPEIQDQIYAQGLIDLVFGFFNLDKSLLDNQFNPQEYIKAINSLLRARNSTDQDQKELVDLVTTVIRGQSEGQNYSEAQIKEIREIVRGVIG